MSDSRSLVQSVLDDVSSGVGVESLSFERTFQIAKNRRHRGVIVGDAGAFCTQG